MCVVCKHFRSTMKTVKTNKNKICCDEKKSVKRAKGGEIFQKKNRGIFVPSRKFSFDTKGNRHSCHNRWDLCKSSCPNNKLIGK